MMDSWHVYTTLYLKSLKMIKKKLHSKIFIYIDWIALLSSVKLFVFFSQFQNIYPENIYKSMMTRFVQLWLSFSLMSCSSSEIKLKT